MKKIAIGLVLVILLVVGVGFFAFDSILKGGIETAGSAVLKTDVTVDSVGISPLSGNGGIRELRIGNPEGFDSPYAMQFGGLDVSVNVGSVFSDVIEIDSIIIQSPEITYETKITTDNIRALMANIGGGGADAPAGETTGAGKKIIIRDFQMLNPQVNLVAAIGSAPVSLPDIRLQDIGERDASVTVAEAAQQILAALNQALLGANFPSLDELRNRVQSEVENRVQELEDRAAEQIQDLEEDVTDQVEDLTNSLRDRIPGIR
jgi:hypothetical protein